MQSFDIAIPVLPCRSLAKTVKFYKALGFDSELFGEDYAILTRGDIELHFFRHNTVKPEHSWAGCYIRVQEVNDIYLAFAGAKLPTGGIPRMDPLQDKPWDMREFAVVDEDGNLLRIGQIIN
jgi:catechol 2,3-dioxygenase-like lactoylglutathione lyase family enzyme